MALPKVEPVRLDTSVAIRGQAMTTDYPITFEARRCAASSATT